jgi:NAD dependent epimerase/dehydratase
MKQPRKFTKNIFAEDDMNWDGKRILVTGADGFIGSHLTELLLQDGCDVRALSYYNSFNHLGWLEGIRHKDNLRIIAGDIRDPHFCMQLTHGIDVVFHLAALIAIPYSYKAPASYVETNVKGTLNMCQAALEAGCKLFVHTSTSEVYGTATYVPIDESHPKQPQSPYSASKIGADMIAMSFYNAFGLPLVVARPFNTYGPRQSARAFIPNIITQIEAGKKLVSVGDLSPTRDLTFVKDTCRGLLMLAECENAVGREVNIGSNYEISMGSLAEKIKIIMKKREISFKVEDERIRPEKSEVHRLWCDNSLLKRLTGFEPEHSLDDGLERTVSWFINPKNLKWYKSDIYNI